MGEPAPTRWWIQWVLGGAGLFMLAAAAAMVLHQSAPIGKIQAPAKPRSAQATALYVQHDGPALDLHWNPDAPAVRAARRGVLAIADGGRESKLELNPHELSSGVASYRPQSGEVTFRLELDGDPAGVIRASAAPEEPRPSPFPPVEKPPAIRTGGQPLKLAPPEPSAEPEVEDPPPPKRSRWSRVAGKIPLLRRLKRH